MHNNSYEKVPDFRRADFDKLRTILENTDWSEIYGIHNVEQAWNMFIDVSEMPLQNAIQCVIGGQQIIVNPNGGILTSEIFC